jgi:recombinational DNA repair protein RecT
MTTNGQGMERTADTRTAAMKVRDVMSGARMQPALRAALAGYMNEETFAAQCYIAAQDPKLARCSFESLMKAFLECAQMGLLPGAAHRHVAMVPRGGEIDVTPQWQGFKFLMERQPGVKRVRPVLVHAKDRFGIEDGVPHHEFDPFDDDREFKHPDDLRGEAPGLRGGYLVIEYDNGDREWHFVSAKKIHRNRVCAQQQNVWRKWFEEMCLKTVIRDAWSKRVVSIDPQLAERVGMASVTADRVEGHDPTRAQMDATPASKQLSERLGATPAMRRADVVDARPSDSGEHDQVTREPGDDDDDPTTPTGTDAPRATQQTRAEGSAVQPSQHTGTPLDSASWLATEDGQRAHVAAIDNVRHLEASARKHGAHSPALREFYVGRLIELSVDDHGARLDVAAARKHVAVWAKEGPQQRAA